MVEWNQPSSQFLASFRFVWIVMVYVPPCFASTYITLNADNSKSFLHLFLKEAGNAGQDEIHAGKGDTVAPHLVFRRIPVRFLQPFDNLVPGLGLCLFPQGFPMGLKDIAPEADVFFRRVPCFQMAAPPVRESLEPCTFCRHQAADTSMAVDERRIFIIRSYQELAISFAARVKWEFLLAL